MNIGNWPEHFTDYVALRLARHACLRITNDKELRAALLKEEDRARRVANAEEVMDEPPGLPPVPFWARSAHSGPEDCGSAVEPADPS